MLRVKRSASDRSNTLGVRRLANSLTIQAMVAAPFGPLFPGCKASASGITASARHWLIRVSFDLRLTILSAVRGRTREGQGKPSQ